MQERGGPNIRLSTGRWASNNQGLDPLGWRELSLEDGKAGFPPLLTTFFNKVLILHPLKRIIKQSLDSQESSVKKKKKHVSGVISSGVLF